MLEFKSLSIVYLVHAYDTENAEYEIGIFEKYIFKK